MEGKRFAKMTYQYKSHYKAFFVSHRVYSNGDMDEDSRHDGDGNGELWLVEMNVDESVNEDEGKDEVGRIFQEDEINLGRRGFIW